MPARIRDNSPERKKEDKKHTRSEKDRSSKPERRHRSSTQRTGSLKDKPSSRTSTSPSDAKRRTSLPTSDDIERQKSESRGSLPYPSFSKAHSKESVGSHPSLNVFTPPATDVDIEKEAFVPVNPINPTNCPPSPPLTDKNAGRPRTASSRGMPVETILEEEKESAAEPKIATLRTKSSRSNGHLRSSSETSTTSPTKLVHRASTPLKRVENANQGPQRSVSQPTRVASPAASSETATEVATNNSSSNATSIAPPPPKPQRPAASAGQAALNQNNTSSFLVKPSLEPQLSRQQTPLDVTLNSPASQFSAALTGPPPPPPAPSMPLTVPKVDYLLQHGGLNQTVPKNLLFAGKPMAVQQAATIPGQPPIIIANLFEPYNTLLGDFEKVISKNGSLAVATGYRSVARRLLDRLEKVFSRDISAEQCECCMCEHEQQLEDSRGVSWGEILELVSGRQDLPNWPPFAFVATPAGLGITLDMQAPMQKVDIDVPEEYREHYIRQSRKTKQSVDKWLSRQGDDPSSPPQEVDDETLTFAILTHLSADQRQNFKDLLGIVDRPLGPPRRAPSPDSKNSQKPAPTPQPRPRMPAVITAGSAIQRLYRLAHAPRDPETAIFLLNNPSMHNALATLAAISDDEWDILISGRFDGFLRSGAEDVHELPNSRYAPSRGSHRESPSPYGMSNSRHQGRGGLRQPTPSAVNPQHGAPIALDEETEIATLAEIERDIYVGMEQLEDAFEALHQRAEAVRRALRERSTGLAAAAQRRRGNTGSVVEVRMGTPASGIGANWESETDDGMGDWDGVSDIAPDDSASNISSARRRRPKRRTERRTPAMIDEEDEGDDSYADESERSRSPKKR